MYILLTLNKTFVKFVKKSTQGLKTKRNLYEGDYTKCRRDKT